MNRRTFNDGDDEKRLLIFRALELCDISENSAVASSFLTPEEQRTVFDALQRNAKTERLFFWGGYKGAERRIAVFLPGWMETDTKAPSDVFSPERENFFLSLLASYSSKQLLWDFFKPLKIKGSGFVSFSHRDALGSLMALGIKRNTIGDIVCKDGIYYTFAQKTVAKFISAELTRIGRDTVACSLCDIDEAFAPEKSFEEISVTVQSPRIDGLIHAICKISRDKAASLISSGSVQLNYSVIYDGDKRINEGDIISVRGYGKFTVSKAGNSTRKGRLRIEIKKYI